MDAQADMSFRWEHISEGTFFFFTVWFKYPDYFSITILILKLEYPIDHSVMNLQIARGMANGVVPKQMTGSFRTDELLHCLIKDYTVCTIQILKNNALFIK